MRTLASVAAPVLVSVLLVPSQKRKVPRHFGLTLRLGGGRTPDDLASLRGGRLKADCAEVASAELRANRGVSSFLPRLSVIAGIAKQSILVLAAAMGAVVLCAAMSTAIVLPLWVFAMHCPRVYTAVCVVCLCAFIVVVIVKRHKNSSIKLGKSRT